MTYKTSIPGKSRCLAPSSLGLEFGQGAKAGPTHSLIDPPDRPRRVHGALSLAPDVVVFPPIGAPAFITVFICLLAF